MYTVFVYLFILVEFGNPLKNINSGQFLPWGDMLLVLTSSSANSKGFRGFKVIVRIIIIVRITLRVGARS